MFVSFVATLVMSMVFRSIASLSRSLTQALLPAALIVLGLIMYTGFAINVQNMRGWSRWINHVNPIAYAFESLMVNEFHARDFACSAFVPTGPGYTDVTGLQRVCSTVGSTAGSAVVNGDAYINQSYSYYNDHKWRNIGILFAFMVGFLLVYLVATGELRPAY